MSISIERGSDGVRACQTDDEKELVHSRYPRARLKVAARGRRVAVGGGGSRLVGRERGWNEGEEQRETDREREREGGEEEKEKENENEERERASGKARVGWR